MHKEGADSQFQNDESRAETIRHLITHPGWTMFFVPEMIRRRDFALGLLCLEADMRQPKVSDNILRSRIAVINEILADGPAAVLEWDTDVLQSEEPLEYQANLEARAQHGHVGHHMQQ